MKVEIIGRTAMLAAIYSADYLPSAIINLGKSNPFCFHSVRANNLSFFEKEFMQTARNANGVSMDDKTKDEELKFVVNPFFEDYHDQSHTCIGCHTGEATARHYISQSEEAASKTTEDCA